MYLLVFSGGTWCADRIRVCSTCIRASEECCLSCLLCVEKTGHVVRACDEKEEEVEQKDPQWSTLSEQPTTTCRRVSGCTTQRHTLTHLMYGVFVCHLLDILFNLNNKLLESLQTARPGRRDISIHCKYVGGKLYSVNSTGWGVNPDTSPVTWSEAPEWCNKIAFL